MAYKKIFNTDLPDYMYASGVVQISISSSCNVRCKFCYNENNPFEIHRVGFRPLEEIKEQIDSYDTKPIKSFYLCTNRTSIQDVENSKYKFFNGRTTGLISTGEPTIHPNFFEILDLIREKNPNAPIIFFSNGTVLTEEFIIRLKKYRPLCIFLTFLTYKQDLWLENYRSNEKLFTTSVSCFELLLKHEISFVPNMLPLFGVKEFENNVKWLSERGVKNVMVCIMAYTKYASEEYINYCINNEVSRKDVHDICNKYNISKTNTLIETCFQPGSVPINHIRQKLNQFKEANKKSYWFTSVAAYDEIQSIIEYIKKDLMMKQEVHVIKVENRAYGGNIVCAGLWTLDDIKNKIEELDLNHENIVLPSIFLNDYGYDLMGENIQDYIKVSKNNLSLIYIDV